MTRTFIKGLTVSSLLLSAVTFISCQHSAVSTDYYNKVKSELPLEAKYIALGKCKVAQASFPADKKIGSYKVWYPADLGTRQCRYPLVIMANGTGVAASRYEAVFRHLASWGFIVAGNEDEESWSGASTSSTLHFMLLQNRLSGSIFHNKVNTTAIGLAGHSQGGVAVFNALSRFGDDAYYRAAYIVSCTQHDLAVKLKWDYDASKVRVPCLLTAGTNHWDDEIISPLSSMRENSAKIRKNKVAVVLARRKGKDHGEMLAEGDGYMTAWFSYWLQGDQVALRAFRGYKAEIAHNNRWQDVESLGW